MLYVGCAIWAYDGWTNSFFPPGLPKDARLQAYSQRLTAVEGNTTFYAIPTVPTVQRWAADTPASFQFVPKFPKVITHSAQLKNAGAHTSSFIGVMKVLGPRLGPLMLQLPPSFGPSRLRTLQDYLEALPDGLEIAVEIRHPDWFTADNGKRLNEMLVKAGASRVIFDVRPVMASKDPAALSAQDKKPNVPLIAEALQPAVVVRYISSPVLEENEPYLQEWIPRLAAWHREGRRVYFFAHCPIEDPSPDIARDVYHRVNAVVGDLPPLPWDEIDKPWSPADLTQLSLF